MDRIFLSRVTAATLRFILVLTFACIGAVPATAAPLDSTFAPPIVVVYPFTVSGNTTDAQAGGNIAVLLSTRLQTLGGVTVKPFVPGTVRADFLTSAQKQNADYYVTGYLTPIGSEVSLITQVVSTYGGTIVWSNTSTIRTYADALGQADGLRTAILSHAQRSLSSIGNAPPAATPEPSTSDAAGVNLTRALGRHRHDAAATAAPTSAAVALAPKRPGVLVTDVGGDGTPDVRAHASTAIASALRRSGLPAGNLAVSGTDAVANAASICKANPGNPTIAVGTLHGVPGDLSSLKLEVATYDCTGKALGHTNASSMAKRGSVTAAVDSEASQIPALFKNGNLLAP